MEHCSIAQDERQSFGFIPLGEINSEICRRIHDSFLDSGVDAIIPIQDPGNCRDADLCGFRDFSKSDFCHGRNFTFHMREEIRKRIRKHLRVALKSRSLCLILKIFSTLENNTGTSPGPPPSAWISTLQFQ